VKAGEFVGEADMRPSWSLSSSAFRLRLAYDDEGVDTGFVSIQMHQREPPQDREHRLFLSMSGEGISYSYGRERIGSSRRSEAEQEV
jgi:hypothetical protein